MTYTQYVMLGRGRLKKRLTSLFVSAKVTTGWIVNNDTRLAVAAYILAILSLLEEEVVSSELLARSVNTNPVVVRRLVSLLNKAGLVEVRRGRGGAALNRSPEAISLLDVYKAVVPKPTACPFFLHQKPNSQCWIGRNIHDALKTPFSKVNRAIEQSLATTTISEIAAFIADRERRQK